MARLDAASFPHIQAPQFLPTRCACRDASPRHAPFPHPPPPEKRRVWQAKKHDLYGVGALLGMAVMMEVYRHKGAEQPDTDLPDVSFRLLSVVDRCAV